MVKHLEDPERLYCGASVHNKALSIRRDRGDSRCGIWAKGTNCTI